MSSNSGKPTRIRQRSGFRNASAVGLAGQAETGRGPQTCSPGRNRGIPAGRRRRGRPSSGTLERCPDLQLIVPHAGGTVPFLVDRISLPATRFVPGSAAHAPAGVEAYLRRLYYELAIATNPHAVASVQQLVGPERLLYGSDWPALDEGDVRDLIQVLDGNPLLQPADRARIAWQNAMELFPRLRSGSAAC